MSRTPLIEVLYFDGCPSHERLLPTVERLAEQSGARLEFRAIETPDAAEAERFLGSPTVRVNGRDVDAGAAARLDYGMKCRLYHFDGRQSPTPPEEWIRAGLSGATRPRERPELMLGETATGSLAAIGIDEQRWEANRLAGLHAPERRLYEQILRGFADGGSLSRQEVAADEGALRTLVERDLVGVGGNGEVAVAYPFSGPPTRHRVRLRDGRAYWAMCSIDALGIAYLVDQPVQIYAREPDSDRTVTVSLDPESDTPTWTPGAAVAVAAASGTGCTSGCACPHINLFASASAAEHYLAKPGLRGTILTVPEATAVARRLFGGLLRRLSDLRE